MIMSDINKTQMLNQLLGQLKNLLATKAASESNQQNKQEVVPMFNPDEYIKKVMTRMHGDQAIEAKMSFMNFYERIELLCAYMRYSLSDNRPFQVNNSPYQVIEANPQLFRITNDLDHTYFEARLMSKNYEYDREGRINLFFQFVSHKVHPYKNGKGHLVVFKINNAIISNITADKNGKLINKGRRWTEELKMMLNDTEKGIRVMYVHAGKIFWGYQQKPFYNGHVGSFIQKECESIIRKMMSISSVIPMAKYYRLGKFDTTSILDDSFAAARFVTDRSDLRWTFEKHEQNALDFIFTPNVLKVFANHKGTKGVLNHQYDKTGVKFLPKDAFGGMNTLTCLTEVYEAALLVKLFRFYHPHVFSRYATEMREFLDLNSWAILDRNKNHSSLWGSSSDHKHRMRDYERFGYLMKFFGYSERMLKIVMTSHEERMLAQDQDENGNQPDPVHRDFYTPINFLSDTVRALKSIKSRTIRNAIREHFNNHPEMNDIRLIHDYVVAEAQKIASTNVDLTKGKYYERFNGHKIELIKEDGSKDYLTMVCAPETHELIKWGTTYNICIGLQHYQDKAKNGSAILIAFEKPGDLNYDSKYLCFAEIKPNYEYRELNENDLNRDMGELAEIQHEFELIQLLGRSNRQLPRIQYEAITNFLQDEFNVIDMFNRPAEDDE